MRFQTNPHDSERDDRHLPAEYGADAADARRAEGDGLVDADAPPAEPADTRTAEPAADPDRADRDEVDGERPEVAPAEFDRVDDDRADDRLDDDLVEDRRVDDGVDDGVDDDRVDGEPVQDPAPVPTAFGATSVGDAVAASAMAGGERGDRSDAVDDPAVDDDPHADRTDLDPSDADRGDAELDHADAELGHDRSDADADDTASHAELGHADTEPGHADTEPGHAELGHADTEPGHAELGHADDTAGHADATDDDGARRSDVDAPATAVGVATPAAVAMAVPAEPVTVDDRSAGRVGFVGAASPVEPAGVEPVGLEGSEPAVPGEQPAEQPVDGLPGSVAAAPVVAMWDDDTARGLRERWREVQLRFVDDPEGATGEAQALVAEAVDALTANLAEQRADLDGWRSGNSANTEHLRVAVRQYRDFLDRLLKL